MPNKPSHSDSDSFEKSSMSSSYSSSYSSSSSSSSGSISETSSASGEKNSWQSTKRAVKPSTEFDETQLNQQLIEAVKKRDKVAAKAVLSVKAKGGIDLGDAFYWVAQNSPKNLTNLLLMAAEVDQVRGGSRTSGNRNTDFNSAPYLAAQAGNTDALQALAKHGILFWPSLYVAALRQEQEPEVFENLLPHIKGDDATNAMHHAKLKQPDSAVYEQLKKLHAEHKLAGGSKGSMKTGKTKNLAKSESKHAKKHRARCSPQQNNDQDSYSDRSTYSYDTQQMTHSWKGMHYRSAPIDFVRSYAPAPQPNRW